MVLREGDVVTFGHPFGVRLAAGVWKRQPDSEYQFIVSLDYCRVLRKKLLCFLWFTDFLRKKILTYFMTDIRAQFFFLSLYCHILYIELIYNIRLYFFVEFVCFQNKYIVKQYRPEQKGFQKHIII